MKNKIAQGKLKTLATAQSLFHRLKSEHGSDRAKAMVTMILENAELRQKISKELYTSAK